MHYVSKIIVSKNYPKFSQIASAWNSKALEALPEQGAHILSAAFVMLTVMGLFVTSVVFPLVLWL